MLVLAYIGVILIAVLLYVGLFSLLFLSLFGVNWPTLELILLNIATVVIALLSIPIISEILERVRSAFKKDEINVVYIIRKLNQLAGKKLTHEDIQEMVEFLAYHLHFEYVGLIFNGRVYGSYPLRFSPDQLRQITTIKRANSDSIWQKPTASTKRALSRLGIKAVAELRNSKGRPMAQLLIGNNVSAKQYDRYNMAQLEVIINLVANVIDLREYSRK